MEESGGGGGKDGNRERRGRREGNRFALEFKSSGAR